MQGRKKQREGGAEDTISVINGVLDQQGSVNCFISAISIKSSKNKKNKQRKKIR